MVEKVNFLLGLPGIIEHLDNMLVAWRVTKVTLLRPQSRGGSCSWPATYLLAWWCRHCRGNASLAEKPEWRLAAFCLICHHVLIWWQMELFSSKIIWFSGVPASIRCAMKQAPFRDLFPKMRFKATPNRDWAHQTAIPARAQVFADPSRSFLR